MKIKNLVVIILFCIFFIIGFSIYNNRKELIDEKKMYESMKMLEYNKEKETNSILISEVKRDDDEISIDEYFEVKKILGTEKLVKRFNESKNDGIKKKMKTLLDDFNNKNIEIMRGNSKKEIEKLLGKTKFIGDSSVKLIADNNYLSPKFYGYKKGYSVRKQIDSIDGFLDEDIENIVLFNGFNVGHINNSSELIKDYEDLIKKIREKIKNVNIYICSLNPASDEKILEDINTGGFHNMHRAKEFDMALRDYFETTDITYVDTKWIIRPEYYSGDGYHFRQSFYFVMIPWLCYIINL